MEEIQYHHHHHHHHHGHENEGHQYATSSQGTVNSDDAVFTEHHYQQQQQQQETITQPTVSVPVGTLNVPTNQTLDGVQTTGSFHSVSSIDSSAEMSKYFPDAQTPSLSPFRHQQEVEGQAQSTAISNTTVTTNTNTVNEGPYIPVSAPTTAQRLPQPVRAPFMAQQQQRPTRPPGPSQLPSGIPSYSSQIEGLSVSQAVVNDVLVDLQSKVINETLQQYHDESSSGSYLEPLPPIYIRAPQPTIILRSDLHRLRAELGNRVRPPVVYRHPAGANQFQQYRFQQNTFQAPRFPVPRQQNIPPEYYGDYRNAAYANSDEYETTTTGDEHRKEKEERLYNQAESPMLNDGKINDNVHSAFDLQGLSTTSFDRHASSYQSSSFLPNIEDQQQSNEKTVLTFSQNINEEQVGQTDNMFSTPVRPRQEITFDINNCIYRCFEAHRQRVARRRAARQARRARRHKQSGQQQQQQQQQYQQVYHTDHYQNFPTQPTYSSFDTAEQRQWQQQQPLSSLHYSDVIPGPTSTSTSVHTSQKPYIPTGTYDYTSIAQSTSLPTDIQQYQSSNIVTTHTSQIPFSALSNSNIDAAVPTEVQSSTSDYYPYKTIHTQEPYIQSNAFEYASHQAVSSTTDLTQQPSTEQQQEQTSFEYSNQLPYSSYSSTDARVPSDIQHLTSEYYQQHQQQIPTQFIQSQGTYVQPSSTFDYTAESTQSQVPTYDYQNIEQQSFQYPYNVENIQQQPSFHYGTIDSTAYVPSQTDIQQTEQKQTFDYYQQQPTSVPVSQVQGTRPSGTFEYTRESYQSQEPIYDYQTTDQQSSQYSYNVGDVQQLSQQDSYNYATGVTNTYAPPQIDTNLTGQTQTFDYSSQVLGSSDYYQQQPTSLSTSQIQEAYAQPSGTFDYTTGNIQSQQPIYNYQDVEQISSQYPYNIQNIEQQQSFDYTSGAKAACIPPETVIQQPEQTQTIDYTSQILSSSDHYQQQQPPISIPVSRAHDSQLLGQRLNGASIPTGTVEYTRQAYYSQEPLPDHYTTETFIEQHQQKDESQSFNVNDYLKRFESELYPQQTGGQLQSSDDRQSITTTPFIIQQNVDIHPSQGAAQSYNLQNYTNETIVSETSQPLPPSSLSYEEDQQHLLQHTGQHSERETSSYETYSSLPPPPSRTTEEIDYQQTSIATNTSDFPPPPTPDRHTYQISDQRQSRSITSIIPSTDQPSIYIQQQPIQPTSSSSSDHGTDDDIKEDEEIFDLRQCIAHCYAKYQDLWNKEEQRKYQEQISRSQQPIPPCNQQLNISSFNREHQEQSRQHLGTGELHYIDGWTQTPSLDVITQSNIVQHTYDQTPSTFDTKPYIPRLSTRDLSTDSRGQQTIEYTPPLITQTRHVIPTVPSSAPLSSYEYTKYEQQQQQPIYDHTLPIPPHLSFNDTDYQPNLYFPSQITAQPRQDENIPFNKYEEQQQQQRYRAYSEPASIQQDSITSIPPLQSSSSQIFEQQTRRSISIPMINQQQPQTQIPSFRLLDNGRAYEIETVFHRRIPRIDPKTGLCLVPCPETLKYAHLPPHLRPELFCVELPPPSTLPPVPPPPPPPPPPPVQQQRWCIKCCCVPGRSLIKKVVYKQVEEEQQHEEESYDYAAVIDQMATKISVRYGNSIMEEGEPFVSGNYHEQLRIIDFPVYVSGKNDPNLTPLVPVN